MNRAADFWTLDDVAAHFGLCRRVFVRDHLPAFQAAGFPLPLPWSRRQRRYNPEAVRLWKQRYELRMGCALLGAARAA